MGWRECLERTGTKGTEEVRVKKRKPTKKSPLTEEPVKKTKHRERNIKKLKSPVRMGRGGKGRGRNKRRRSDAIPKPIGNNSLPVICLQESGQESLCERKGGNTQRKAGGEGRRKTSLGKGADKLGGKIVLASPP